MLPPETLNIRPTRTSDLEAVCDMVEGLAAHHNDAACLDAKTLFDLTLGPRPWVHCLVATLSDEPVGYAALIRQVQLQFARKFMDLTHLYVMPQLRGQGIGSALISAAQEEARLNNCEALTVGTAPGNLRAAALYRNAGFEERAPAGAQFIMALCRG